MKRMLTGMFILSTALLPAISANAAFDIQITEVWFGQDGADLTSDWFELTNYGDMPWVAANDGGLWYDDDSASPDQADPLMGVSMIAPGESAVFVVDPETAVTEFHTIWDPVKSGFQVGWTDGAGLGQGGNPVEDVVNIWLGDPLGSGSIIDSESYGMTDAFDAQSWDVPLQEYSTVGNASGAVATIALGGNNTPPDQPAIASPGMVVPEPSALGLGILAALGFVPVGRQRRSA